MNSPYDISESDLISLFNREPIDIWINSFGGCRSNYVKDMVSRRFSTYNTAHEFKACHYIKPLDVKVGSGIFCYIEDVGIALTSQINRGMEHNFIKLMEVQSEFSVEKWLRNISVQIDNWTSKTFFPIVIMNTDRLYNYKSEFEEMYGVGFQEFKQRETTDYHSLVKPHMDLIKTINQKLKTLDDYFIT